MRLASLALLLVPFAFAAPALAQEPFPDTTAAWRYFPLAVGDVWEYHCYADFCNDHVRSSIPGDTLVGEERFFVYVVERFGLDGQPTGELDTYYLRFDALTARVVELDDRRPFVLPLCRLDAGFYAEVDCDEDGLPDGTTDGDLENVLLGGQTITTTRKTYDLVNPDLGQTYIAGLGMTSGAGFNGGYTLRYAVVGGLTYGEPLILSVEPGASEARLALSVYPNPSRGAATLALTVPVPQTVAVEAFDVLGRRVYRETHAASGATSLPLDGHAWKPGVYVVRVTAEDGARATARLVRQ